jgi:hypothetical protein
MIPGRIKKGRRIDKSKVVMFGIVFVHESEVFRRQYVGFGMMLDVTKKKQNPYFILSTISLQIFDLRSNGFFAQKVGYDPYFFAKSILAELLFAGT